MVVLVVGGAGYVGSHAAHALRSDGHDVVIYDNLSTGHRSLADGFELIVGEIADRVKLSPVLRRVDAVMHFAGHAYVGESVENPRKYFRNNVEAALTLLNACVDGGIRRIVFSSSCTVYGIPSKIPMAEDAPREPVSAYGASKLFFEHALEAYDRAYGVKYVALRYFNAAGADESGTIGELHQPETHLIPSALQAVRGERAPLELFGSDYPTPDGTCVRDYIHVNDLAEAHGLALRYLCGGNDSGALNLGTGRGYSVEEVLKKVEEVTGHVVPRRMAPRRPGDPPSLVADPSRAKEVLRWKAKRSLDDIVKSAWDWMGRWKRWERSA
ncbi:MAG: UDP-glucose 4-epimerase GalE [Terriglobales bacterium]